MVGWLALGEASSRSSGVRLRDMFAGLVIV
jgi:hypothetical protein